MGNVLNAGLGQAPATTAARLAGVPASVPASTVNKVCASGMKAVMMAAQAIRAGQADIIVAGGMESMSRAPYLLPVAARMGGLRFGEQSLLDSVQHDGLTDAESGLGMGLCGEKCAEDHGISREDSDAFATRSYQRAVEAKKHLSREIVPITIPGVRGKADTIVSEDDELANVLYLHL